MGLKKRISALLICSSIVLGSITPAYADGANVVTLGTNLSAEQKQMVLNYFGVKENEVVILEVNNQEERKYLEGVATEAQLGTRTYSCAYVQPTSKGNGLNVKTVNLTYVTSSMIASTLTTCGITDANVIAMTPLSGGVSGTGALTGIMKAFEDATGKPLDEEKKENFAPNGASLMGENYEYKRYGTVKVLHTKDNSIEEMKMDEYLLGVVSAEMPADFEEEALKAQAVVARTYTVYKIEHNQSKHGEADICDNSACCQAWISKDDRMARWDEDKRESNWEKIEKAVSSTAGKVVTYNGEVIDAFFHSNSGGKTEEVSNVWGGSDLPYLQSVETSGEDAYSQYQSEAIFTKEEFEKKIKDKYPEFTIDYNDENCIKVIEYTQGNRVKTIKIGNLELSGVEVRSLLALRSANFTTQISENEIKFTVKGYGHGVGMSQTGADSMAKQGSNYEEIIKHYYTGVEITNL